ncbi:5-oxoprolinase subunit PxpB [Staphylococcus sp. SQ8-PEA]|uniref:5-oxoprolinase subunit PxpB n=1 Tax=Staphylococcus marylandisciuri TaxID=2981529 RepID=A0ABT2QR42_9STAP|nr:5-oxoprolinase subunit PxpB [Staphylococcus marylandisciuri]MCU5746423.1 5-oxoprolinase subunit PxpB [Staphylococcus marylandisciuri]
MKYKIINEQAIMVYFEDHIAETIFQQVQQLVHYIHSQKVEGIEEVIPSYRAILINFDLKLITPTEVIRQLNLDDIQVEDLEKKGNNNSTIYLPVWYGDSAGPDIEEVATHNNLSIDEVIELHTNDEYLIYMLGFMPGFPFLGGLNEKLHTPRRSEPRTSLPEGSVGIANQQTGLYPSSSPGGWQIIGRTPIKVFSLERDPMCIYQPGDKIKFYAISQAQFNQIVEEQLSENFDIRKWVSKEHEYID